MYQRFTMSILAVSLLTAFGHSQVTVNKSSLPRTAAWSGYILGEPKPKAFDLTSPEKTRHSDSTAIAPSIDAFGYWHAGGISSGFFDVNGGGMLNHYNDLIAFRMLESGSGSTSTLSVCTSTLVSTLDSSQSVRALGLGSVSNLGEFAFRFDNGSGAPTAIGKSTFGTSCPSTSSWTFSGVFPGTLVMGVPQPGGTGTGFSLLINGLGTSTQYQMPSIGENDSTVFVSDFTKRILYTPPTTTHRTLGALEDQRGSVTYNQACAKYAILRTVNNTNTTVDRVEIYDLNNLMVPNPKLVSLPAGWAGTNYFGRTSFAGPAQIAMNDNCDIAIVAYQTGTNPSLRFKRLLLARGCENYATWYVADTFDTINNATGANGGSLAVSSPALDNACNIWISVPISNPADSSVGPNSIINAIYRYTPTIATSGPGAGCQVTGWTRTEILREGDLIGGNLEVELIPTQVPTEDRYNANIRNNNTTGIGPESVQHFGNGGLFVAIRTKATGSSDLRWKWMLIDQN